MSVSDTDKIDFIGIGANGNCVLTIADHLEWQNSEEHMAMLQDKLNTYLRYIKSGDIHSGYPESEGKPIEIVVALRFYPPRQGINFLREAQAAIAGADVGLSWRVF